MLEDGAIEILRGRDMPPFYNTLVRPRMPTGSEPYCRRPTGCCSSTIGAQPSTSKPTNCATLPPAGVVTRYMSIPAADTLHSSGAC
jgi:hypothetical protein